MSIAVIRRQRSYETIEIKEVGAWKRLQLSACRYYAASARESGSCRIVLTLGRFLRVVLLLRRRLRVRLELTFSQSRLTVALIIADCKASDADPHNILLRKRGQPRKYVRVKSAYIRKY